MTQPNTQQQILISFCPDEDPLNIQESSVESNSKAKPDIRILFNAPESEPSSEDLSTISITFPGPETELPSGPGGNPVSEHLKKKPPRIMPLRKKHPAVSAPTIIPQEEIPQIVYPVTNGVMLAEEYRKNGIVRVNPKGWWASEKWDGVRALWDGRSLWTRAGHMINAPEWFIGRLPPGVSLDGELYIKHNWFNKTSGIIRNKVPNQLDWAPIRYMVFDIPHLGHHYPFEQRMATLKEVVHRWGEPMVFVNQIQIQSAQHLETVHKTLVLQGGEGTMLREPGSMYHGNTRSPKLLKVKDQFEEDCLVCGWEEGKNRNCGRLGALHIKWADPKGIWSKFGERWDVEIPFYGQFKVGSGLSDADRCLFSDAQRFYPVGTRIKLAFTQLQKSGKPKHPAFKGIRVR